MLLERLRWPPPGGTTSVRPDPEDPVELRESIRRNLERILNSRQGLCPLYPMWPPDHAEHVPDYGLPDVVALVSQLPDGRWEIEQSIQRIDAGDYGYCDETGEPIGVGRLLARPTATLSLEAQQRRELKQKMFGD